MQAEELLRHERAALERASALRYQQLVDMMPQCVWGNRADGTIEIVNRVWVEYTGLDLVEANDGGWTRVCQRIWVESSGTPGEGSVFRFSIPLRASPRPTLA